MNADRRYENILNAERSLADFAHELRNPLAGVRAAIQIVYARLPSSQEQDMLRDALQRLSDIDSLLGTLLVEVASSHAMLSNDATLGGDRGGEDAPSRSGVRALTTEISPLIGENGARRKGR